MKLTLRKANAIQAAINEAIKSLDLNTGVTLNEFEDVQVQIASARERFFANDNVRSKLTLALAEIRTKVAQANAASGINDHLANVAYLEKQIGYNTMLAGKGAQTALKVLNGQVKKFAEVKEDIYGRSMGRDVATSIFTEEEVEQFKSNAANLKRDKQRVQDTLLELNVQTEISLDLDTAGFLVEASIL
jgi:hypothetical protein